MNSRSHNWHEQPVCATGAMDLMSDLSLLGIDDKTLDQLIEFKEPGKRPLSPPINELFQREVICDKRKEKQQLTEEPPAKRFRMEPNVNPLPPPVKTRGISVTKDDERLLVDLFMYGCGLVAVGYENRPSFTHDIMNPGNPGIVTFEKRYNTMCVPFRDTRAYPGIELAAGIWNDVKLSSFEELNPSLGISSVKFDSSVSHIDDLLVKHGRNFGGTYPLYTEIDSKISQLFVNREWLVVGNRVRTPEQNRGSHIFTPISDVDLEQIHGPLSAKLSVPDPMCLLNMLEQSTVLGSPDPFRLCLVLGSTTVMENLARYARRSEADLPSDYQDYSARILKLLDSLNVRYSKCSEEQQDLRCFLNLHSSKSTFNHIYWIAPDDARRVLLRIISGLIERNFSLPRSQCCPRMAFDLHLVPGTCELYTENLNTILHLAQNGPNWKLLSEDVNRFCDRIHRGDSELDVLIFRLSCIFSTRKCISEQGVPIIDGIPLSGAVLETLSSLKSGTRPQLESMLSMYHQIQTINQRLASQIGKMSSSAEELTKLQERASSDSNATQTRWEESANNMAQSINNQITTSVELLRQFITAIPINVSHHLTGMAPLPVPIVAMTQTPKQKKPARKRKSTPPKTPVKKELASNVLPEGSVPQKRKPGRPPGSKNKNKMISKPPDIIHQRPDEEHHRNGNHLPYPQIGADYNFVNPDLIDLADSMPIDIDELQKFWNENDPQFFDHTFTAVKQEHLHPVKHEIESFGMPFISGYNNS